MSYGDLDDPDHAKKAATLTPRNGIKANRPQESIPKCRWKEAISTKDYPIGRLELTFCFAVWIVHSALAFWLAYKASTKDHPNARWLNHWMERSPYMAEYRIDNSDLEWKLLRTSILEMVATYILHSVVFHYAIRNLSRTASSIFLVVFWLALHVFWTSPSCILLLAAHVIVTTGITFYLRNQAFAWVSCLVFVLKGGDWAPFSKNPSNYYKEFNVYLYTSVQILNFCIYLSKRRKSGEIKSFDFRLTLDYLEYLLYPMYSTVLIVLFEDFQTQMDNLRSKIAQGNAHIVPSVRCILWQSIRLVFWFVFLECFLHLCGVNAYFNSPFTMLNGLHNYEKASIAYVAGQFFHVKYVFIFGLPRMFALIDGLTPPGAAICISRVSKYSQMWRYFDQGLYQFLKNQVYIPLMKSQSSSERTVFFILRRFGAMIAVFLFVLTWHGLSSNYFYWVCLSALELCIERLGRELIQQRIWWQKIKDQIGMFFFLGKTGIGDHIFQGVLVAGANKMMRPWTMQWFDEGFVMLHLFCLGYCFNHVCLYLEYAMPPNNKRLENPQRSKRRDPEEKKVK
ncbi:MBOAT, membrane-bound o-acyltransferase family domain-containing protein [Ditylenchus destructor]|nr:MBOAT, membrane-bound o-acyltransferase family domain-containing protein [Ditylenchus destructor]